MVGKSSAVIDKPGDDVSMPLPRSSQDLSAMIDKGALGGGRHWL
jgi:hypothetical protein